MTDTGGDDIGAALLALGEDDEMADEAGDAIFWICGERGREAITQRRVQDFCWKRLPEQWMPLDWEAVAETLARLLDLLGLDRYAGICRSQTTWDVLAAYEAGEKDGLAAYRSASAASGVCPPDLPELAWSSEEAMNWQERAAWTSACELMERAVDSGDLVPGARGWKARQRELVRAHLNAPQVQLRGKSFAETVLAERIAVWAAYGYGSARENILGELAGRLLEPVRMPDDATAGGLLPRWRWLLEQFDAGIPLTQNGNLGRAFVQENAERFNWELSGQPRFESDLFELQHLHDLARRLQLIRRKGRTLTLAPKGKRMLADPEQFWRATAAGLIHGDEFTVFTGELFLALLIEKGPLDHDTLIEIAEGAASDAGFADIPSYRTPDARAVSRVMHETVNPCRALELTVPGKSWWDRRYEFTPAGAVIALEALRVRAISPVRVTPFPWM